MRCAITFKHLPRASAIHDASWRRDLTGSYSKYPRLLSASASRFSSVSAGSPPATSICIIIDVPERGRPDTIVIVSASGPQGGTMSSCMSESTS